MRTGGEHPTAEHAALALYLLGALDEAERVAFEAHLAGCGECLSAAGEMGSVTSALGGLDAADWDDLGGLPEFVPPAELTPPSGRTPVPSAGLPPSVAPDTPPGGATADAGMVAGASGAASTVAGAASGGRVGDGTAPGTDVDTGAEPSPVEPASTTAGAEPGTGATPTSAGGTTRRGTGPRAADTGRPAGSRPAGSRPGGGGPGTTSAAAGTRPADPARRRRLVLWSGVAAAVVAVVLAGGVAAVTGFGDRSGVVLTATGEAPAQGVSLSVAITTDEGTGSTIRITATGLRQGLRYRLFAVTRDGVTHVVRDWTASTGPQEVTGELSLPVADLAFVTVGLVDGTAIVTAPISR
ncbi:zf-HC2 domain-containing protein [Micromonospora sp. WMMD987]|uniref:zf-HC2 domain-containing protein n=1 Tax=Micromonospora sp. WMMD987 TaxID=3016089 RepID=UPI00249AA5EF|nr:zf-HC2 domain-containing protein [Micromonospora sp. WMMD987]WFE93146.1 zf-HC2 domain-containing protein [Micromonospora sp. WMMD987]